MLSGRERIVSCCYEAKAVGVRCEYRDMALLVTPTSGEDETSSRQPAGRRRYTRVRFTIFPSIV
jgi:hypothetical protein